MMKCMNLQSSDFVIETSRFIEHSLIVTRWDVPQQRSFGARLLRKTAGGSQLDPKRFGGNPRRSFPREGDMGNSREVPFPVAQLFGAILNALKIWPELHRRAIRCDV